MVSKWGGKYFYLYLIDFYKRVICDRFMNFDFGFVYKIVIEFTVKI